MSIKRVKSLAKDSLIYGVSGIITRLITVFLVPIYTHIFSPEDYGTLNIINTTFGLVGMFAVFALDSACARWYYDTTDESDRKTTFASWFWFQFVTSCIFIVLLIAATPLASKHLLKLPLSIVFPLWLLPAVTLIFNILPTMIINWFRLHNRPVATVTFTLTQSITTIGFTLLFVVKMKIGLLGVFYALLLSGAIFSFVALYQMKRWLLPRYFSRKRLIEMLRFSSPLIPAALAYWVLNATDAYFILWFKDKIEVGLFAIGASLASGVALITGAFQQAWGPFAYSIIDDPDAPKTYAEVFYIFGVISSIVILGMFLFSPEALRLLTSPMYYSSANVAAILSISVVLTAFSYIASIGTNIAKDTKSYAIGIFIAAIITVIFDIVLIPYWGKEGSAIATVLGQVIVPIFIFYRAQKLYPIPYRFGPVILMLLLAISIGILTSYCIAKVTFGYALLIKLVVFIMYFGLLGAISRKYLILILEKLKAKNN
ncbi:oligosaccharide flippase family protein [Taibaiella lutea]|uniref:Oligosaccharide flippase family protein n=1 Tax=Taibaiella lutea TaxID=2608001 RepID=A0A5M6CH70_9BACT|nr:oligosaccharide flippase family protein [Taibaiella lutea]KAA5533770.1 oligosaccharide flippase family protein [Taibaiella lutea]